MFGILGKLTNVTHMKSDNIRTQNLSVVLPPSLTIWMVVTEEPEEGK